jgi:hypothetical protein
MFWLIVSFFLFLLGISLMQKSPERARPRPRQETYDGLYLLAYASPPEPSLAPAVMTVSEPVKKYDGPMWDPLPIQTEELDFKLALAHKWGCKKWGIKKEAA